MTTQRNGDASESERLHSVRRALAVLEALATRPGGATPKELSLALGLHLSTCYRLLNTLVSARYVARDPGGNFRLGARVAYLNHCYLSALRPPPAALPFVHALQLATAETAVLCQLEGDAAVNTAVVAGTRPGSVPPGYVGLATPAHAFASGRALLAGLPAPRLEAYLARMSAEPDASFPLTNPGALRAELDQIRHDGYALDRGGSKHGVCCVAAPVLDASGVTEAAVASVVPFARFRQEEPALVTTILAVTRTISALRPSLPPGETDLAALYQEPDAAGQDTIEAAISEMLESMARVS